MLDNTIGTMYIPNIFEINEFFFNEITPNTCGHKLAFLTHLFLKKGKFQQKFNNSKSHFYVQPKNLLKTIA